jgi:hypothetical protein
MTGSSRLVECSAPMAWAASKVARVMIGGWAGSGHHSHWSSGTGTDRPAGVVRRRPKTMWPVYLGLRKIA